MPCMPYPHSGNRRPNSNVPASRHQPVCVVQISGCEFSCIHEQLRERTMASADSKASSSASSKANLNPDNLVRRRAKHAGSWYSANGKCVYAKRPIVYKGRDVSALLHTKYLSSLFFIPLRAAHAAIYPGDRLAKQLQGWLDDVKIDLPPVRAMVCPYVLTIRCTLCNVLRSVVLKNTSLFSFSIQCRHAGYDYSGPTAAYAYKHITPQLLEQNKIKRIFIIGPSHHHFTRKCKLTQCQQYDTPVGNLRIDSPSNILIPCLSSLIVC